MKSTTVTGHCKLETAEKQTTSSDQSTHSSSAQADSFTYQLKLNHRLWKEWRTCIAVFVCLFVFNWVTASYNDRARKRLNYIRKEWCSFLFVATTNRREETACWNAMHHSQHHSSFLSHPLNSAVSASLRLQIHQEGIAEKGDHFKV